MESLESGSLIKRRIWAREGAIEIVCPVSGALAYLSEYIGHDGALRYSLQCFRPKAVKPSLNVYYRKESERAAQVERFLQSNREHVEAKAAKREKAKEARLSGHPFKVGDIFHHSFGYNMTLNEFYQVVAVKGLKITVREIAESYLSGGGYSGKSTAVRDKFVSEKLITKIAKVYVYHDGIRTDWSVAGMSLWDGNPVYYNTMD